jgi:uncharacterized repeat protein (TIGR03803 family)
MLARLSGQIALLLVMYVALAAGAQAATLKTLLSFAGSSDGQAPYAAMTNGGGVLYGSTSSGGLYFAGTVFATNPATGATTTIHSFTGGADGSGPTTPVLFINGDLYGTTPGGGANGQGTLFSINPKTHAETVLWNFTGGTEGGNPYSQLLAYGGYFYGTTLTGGAYGQGTVFRFDPVARSVKTLHSFGGGKDGSGAYGGLVNYDGQLYGTTEFGGGFNSGIVYRVNPATGAENVLYAFTGGADGGQINAGLTFDGGSFYGTSLGGGTYGWGCVYRINPATGVETTIYSFSGGADGAGPFGGLVRFAGLLWGTTNSSLVSTDQNGGGTVFSVDPTTGNETTVYAFGTYATPGNTTGFGPVTGLTEQGGTLYGVAAYGGPYSGGTVFGLGNGTSFRVVHAFDGSGPGINANAGVIDISGALFGTASLAGPIGQGTVFKVNHAAGPGINLHTFAQGADGGHSYAALVDVGGMLYGTTSGFPGTVFKIDAATGAESLVATFDGTSEGNPEAPLISVGGTLYGTTFGNPGGNGSIFSIDPATGEETELFAFGGRNPGAYPKAGLINVNGILYGTTSDLVDGSGYGTVFKFDPSTRVLTTLYSFTAAKGGHPIGSLVQLGSALYGTSSGGGAAGIGSVFKVDIATGAFSTVYSFTAQTDGGAPLAGLAVFDGKLIGTASDGGSSGGGGAGTVFEIDPATGSETTLYAFSGGADGGSPQCTLISAFGVIYGTTSSGGAGNRGTVFSLTP